MKLTVESLAKLRDELQARRTSQQDDARAIITVHMGTCGVSAGARDVMTALLDALKQHPSGEVCITTSGCAGLCSREPMATVQLREQAPVKYVELDGKKMVRILEEHVFGGSVVKDYALAMGNERIAQ